MEKLLNESIKLNGNKKYFQGKNSKQNLSGAELQTIPENCEFITKLNTALF